MQIHVNRGGEQLGPYSIEEVKSHLANGTLLPTDLAWQDGMTDWVPINSTWGQPHKPPATRRAAHLLHHAGSNLPALHGSYSRNYLSVDSFSLLHLASIHHGLFAVRIVGLSSGLLSRITPAERLTLNLKARGKNCWAPISLASC